MAGFRSGTREYEADFLASGTPGANLSRTLRPDALAFDQQTCFTLGPAAQGDNSQGAVGWVWRVRHTATPEGGVIVAARAADAGDAWLPDETLFQYAGAPVIELDAAFDQNGRVVVVAERATGAAGEREVWVYFYDPTLPGFSFQSVGPGRTPRAILDEASPAVDGDVLVFYLDAERLRFRAQRDRYAVAYDTPVLASPERFVEEAAKATDGRVVVLLSERDPATGTYQLLRLESLLYPHFASMGGVAVTARLTSGDLRTIVVEPATLPEALAAAALPLGGTLALPVIIVGPPDAPDVSFLTAGEALATTAVPVAGVLAAALIVIAPPGWGEADALTGDAPRLTVTAAPHAGELATVVILVEQTGDLRADQRLTATATPLSGILD